jgi:hypothetical protein
MRAQYHFRQSERGLLAGMFAGSWFYRVVFRGNWFLSAKSANWMSPSGQTRDRE